MTPGYAAVRWLWIIAALLALPCLPARAESEPTAEQDALKIQVLMRLDNLDVNANPKLKALVLRHLNRIRGTDQFVDLAERFDIREVHADLLDLAATKPDDNAGVKAARLLAKRGDARRLLDAIGGDDDAERSANLITALGLTNDKQAEQLLLSIAGDDARPIPVRSSAVRSLAQTPSGQRLLLDVVKRNEMPSVLATTFTTALAASTDPRLRADAAKLLPMPATKDAKPLPPLAELVQRRGDPGNGQLMFARATCNTCHVVDGQGADFGPDLSQIGDKLSREAMYVSILDPSAGIAHSYEGVRIQTDEGIDLIGIITSEGDDELTIKMPRGVTQTLKPSQVIDRQKLTTSVMPAGLTAALTAQELIDLVEYLTTLKKAGE